MDTAAVKEVIQMYFDAGYEFDSDKLDRVFHKTAHIYGHGENGTLIDWDRDFFIKLAGSSEHDASSPDYPRQDEILSIDFTGPDTAVARVKLRIGSILYTDILSFMRLDGKWAVISKLFSGELIQ